MINPIEIIIDMIKMCFSLSIGFTMGFIFGTIISNFGFLKTILELPVWITTLSILMISIGIFCIIVIMMKEKEIK